jgi:hypothetical protein
LLAGARRHPLPRNNLICKCSNPLRNDYRAQSQLLHPIDFSPLAKATAANFKMNFAVTSHDNTRTPMVCTIDGGSAVGDMALAVKLSLPAGWDVEQDGSKLVIKSFKGSPIKSVEITLDGEKKELTPTVKRLKPEDKKEGK